MRTASVQDLIDSGVMFCGTPDQVYENDISRLRWILHQQREHFLPLKVIKERLESGELFMGAIVAGEYGLIDAGYVGSAAQN